MKQNIIVIFSLILLLFTSLLCYPDLGENFEAGGITFGGGIFFLYNPGKLFDPENKFVVIDIDARPDMSIFIFKNQTIRFAVNFHYRFQHNSPSDYYNQFHFGCIAGYEYFFVNNPEADKGFVRSIGFRCGISFLPGRLGRQKSLTINEPFNIYINAGPSFSAYYFINDRVAPFIDVSPFLNFPVYSSRDTSEIPYFNRVSFQQYLYIGISVHFPRNSIVLIPIGEK